VEKVFVLGIDRSRRFHERKHDDEEEEKEHAKTLENSGNRRKAKEKKHLQGKDKTGAESSFSWMSQTG
jgi:hypothetical protein